MRTVSKEKKTGLKQDNWKRQLTNTKQRNITIS